MKISVILAHPHLGSFNHAIADSVVRALQQNGHTVTFHDLYREKFEPVLPYEEISRNALLPPVISQHCTEIVSMDGIVFVHPDWWGMPPAILKGWIDRVMRPGVAYRFDATDKGEGIPAGLLKAGSAIVFNTSNTPRQRELDVFGDPLERLWKDCVCNFCGIPRFHRRMFGVVVTSTKEDREAWLSEVKDMVNWVFPREKDSV